MATVLSIRDNARGFFDWINFDMIRCYIENRINHEFCIRKYSDFILMIHEFQSKPHAIRTNAIIDRKAGDDGEERKEDDGDDDAKGESETVINMKECTRFFKDDLTRVYLTRLIQDFIGLDVNHKLNIQETEDNCDISRGETIAMLEMFQAMFELFNHNDVKKLSDAAYSNLVTTSRDAVAVATGKGPNIEERKGDRDHNDRVRQASASDKRPDRGDGNDVRQEHGKGNKGKDYNKDKGKFKAKAEHDKNDNQESKHPPKNKKTDPSDNRSALAQDDFQSA